MTWRGERDVSRRRVAAAICWLGGLFLMCGAALCRAETQRVVVEDPAGLRALSDRYLGDPDLWEMILKYNGYGDVSDLEPKAALRIPRREYENLRQSWDAVDRLITDAGREGAAVLAPDPLDAATRLWAASKRSAFDGALAEAEELSREAETAGKKALSLTLEKKTQSVSAVLARKQGTVESRKPEKTVWIDAPVGREFTEMERVRTLADSFGEILFIDGGRIRLAEHSLTVIGVMRTHRIIRRTETSVQVLRGDVRVQLASIGGGKRFSLETPEASASVGSHEFRASRDRHRVTRIANYDGEIRVTGGGGAVTVGKNEGTRVESGAPPQTPKALLPFPEIMSPVSGATIESLTLPFQWKPVAGASRYVLEIAADAFYGKMAETVRVSGTSLQWRAPRPGQYYFRIHSVDGDGLPGPVSPSRYVILVQDTTPPYLVLFKPRNHATRYREELTVTGMTEPDAALRINDAVVNVAADGGFSNRVTLHPGENRIAVVASDAAGNRSALERSCIFDNRGWLIRLNVPEHLIVNVTPVPVSGERRANTRVTIDGRPISLPRRFDHLLALPEGRHAVVVTAAHPSGEEQTIHLDITVDLTPPEIRFDSVVGKTRKDTLVLTGTLSEPGDLFLENQPVPVEDGRFSVSVPLSDGENEFSFSMRDLAGNETVRTLTLFRDAAPPVIGGYRLNKTATKGAEIVSLEINARDDGSGLARSSIFELAVAENRFLGSASLGENGRYVGEIFIPPGAAGRIRVTEIRIQDHMGNLATAP